jgi:carboxypeptidase C (cathepsin A)
MTEKTDNKTPEKQPERKEPQDKIVTTQHTVTIEGRELRYTVTVGTMVLREESEKGGDNKDQNEGYKPKAEIFFTAYTLDWDESIPDAEHRRTRPITFAFNGGPGSSSAWLHLGALGPRRVEMGDAGTLLPPPYRLVENEFSILDVTDLVFIDPVTTGYSRAVEGENPRQFHNFEKDIASVGDFIRLYTTRYNRWVSPKFLAGESYGTTRSAGLSGYLQERHGLYLNGIILISAILNFQTARFTPGNDLPYILFLPTYAATAWYHNALPADLQKRALPDLLAEVEKFALGEYTLALMKGDALPENERKRVARKLARYTGLSPDYIHRTNLRVEIMRFTKELLRGQRRTIGRLDTRFKGFDRDAAGETWEFDPSLVAIMGPYTATLNDYVRTELEFESDLPYEILTDRVWPWGYENVQNQYLNVGETLRKAMTANPFLKVLVANGYYDLATPYFATRYTFDHLQLEEPLRANYRMTFYEAGHMMYLHMPSLAQPKRDMTDFIREAVPANKD